VLPVHKGTQIFVSVCKPARRKAKDGATQTEKVALIVLQPDEKGIEKR